VRAHQRGESWIVAVDDLQHAIDRRQHLSLGLLQRGAQRARANGLADGLQDRLEVVEALGVHQRGDLGVARGRQHVGPKLDELCPALAERLDQRIGGRRAGLGETARGVAELGAQIEEALGQRGKVAGKIVEFRVHVDRQGFADLRNSGRRKSNSKREQQVGDGSTRPSDACRERHC
jgi:hypothetical protein